MQDLSRFLGAVRKGTTSRTETGEGASASLNTAKADQASDSILQTAHTTTRRDFHRQVAAGLSLSLSNGPDSICMNLASLVTGQAVTLTESKEDFYSFGILAPDFFENLIAQQIHNGGDGRGDLLADPDAVLFFRMLNRGFNYFGLTAHPHVQHPIEWKEFTVKYLPTCPCLDADRLLEKPALLKLFCRGYTSDEHNVLRSRYAQRTQEIDVISAWRAFCSGDSALRMIDEKGRVETYSPQSVSHEQLHELKHRVLKLILPEPIITNVNPKGSKEHLTLFSESSSFHNLSLEYDSSFLGQALDILDKRCEPRQLVAQLINAAHDYKIERLYQFFQANPAHLRTFCSGYEKIRAEIFGEVHRTTDDSSSGRSEQNRACSPNHFTWGGAQFHPDLRRYRQSLFPVNR